MARDEVHITYDAGDVYESPFSREALFEGVRRWHSGGRIMGWPSPQPRIAIPELVVPPVPEEPKPEPESASVQVLRGLLEKREAAVREADARIKSRFAQIEEAEKRAADLRTRNEEDGRLVAAANEAIDQIRVDIRSIGGQP